MNHEVIMPTGIYIQVTKLPNIYSNKRKTGKMNTSHMKKILFYFYHAQKGNYIYKTVKEEYIIEERKYK